VPADAEAEENMTNREQAILNIIKKIDDKHYGENTDHDPEEKALREMYAMGIASEISTIARMVNRRIKKWTIIMQLLQLF